MDDPGVSALKSSACVVAELGRTREALRVLCERVGTLVDKVRTNLASEQALAELAEIRRKIGMSPSSPLDLTRLRVSLEAIEAEIAIARRALTGSIEVMDARPNRE